MFHVVLVEPEIPANTGNIARTCLAAGAALHLVRPLGFEITDRTLKRAGLDYWHEVEVRVWDGLVELEAAMPPGARRWFLTTKASRAYTDADFTAGDWLFFGRETKGLPEPLLAAHPGETLVIPMAPGSTRSLNLAVSVGIVVFEGLRQVRARPGAGG